MSVRKGTICLGTDGFYDPGIPGGTLWRSIVSTIVVIEFVTMVETEDLSDVNHCIVRFYAMLYTVCTLYCISM